MSRLNDLKRRHNAIHERGCELYAESMKIYHEMMELRKEIEEIEGDEYDEIPLIFGGGFNILESDE